MRDSERPSRALARAGAVLEIDLAAIVANWRRLAAELKPGIECAAVVKADAYGLGVARVAPRLAAAGCTLFFVATIDEGLALRRLLPSVEIAIFDGLLPGTAREFRDARLIPVLNDLDQIALWRKSEAVRSLPAMIHIDSGMSRLGLSPPELRRLAEAPDLLDGLTLRAIISHLACADEAAHPMNAQQLTLFRLTLADLPRAPASLAASAGIFLGTDYHFDMVRPGAALYGINPTPPHPNRMAQVIRLKGRIVQVRDVDSGITVGYGAAHRMERAGRIATVAVGYADGWLRSSSHRGAAGIAGARVPIIGRISMDLMTLDVTGIDPALARPGAFVDLIDETHGVDEIAATAGTIGYEILTSLGARYHRIYRGEAS
ncbi:MAG TPA: alanine racemase [Stellaceae bacterium]|nr:alanine racemase [Stellaceae bacterium]